MKSIQYPDKAGLEYFVSVYLPGFLISITFLYVAEQEKWIDGLLIKAHDESLGIDNNLINSGIIFALYSVYFIAVPLISGLLSDGLRHSLSRWLTHDDHRKNCSQTIEWLQWNFPNKEGYSQWKDSENIYLRRADKSYFLYHTYEFFGNLICAILISAAILFIKLVAAGESFYFILFSISLVITICLFSMYTFWKENNELCKDWEIYRIPRERENKRKE